MAKFPHNIYSSIEAVEINDSPIQDFCVSSNDLRLECRLNRKIENNYLVVVPNGAVDRSKAVLPAFGRWNYHSIFNSPILSISDPALFLDDNLRIGWFAGTKDLDIAQFTADVVEKVAHKLGIAKNRIIFWGSSAGGYTSILLATKIDGAKFISINGQTTIADYYPGHVEDYRKVFDSSLSVDEIMRLYPNRWSVINALEASHNVNKGTKGLIGQNTVDKMHYNKHYIPFCEKFNIPIEGGHNSKYGLWSLLFEDSKGHGPENAEIAKKLVKDYLPQLLDEDAG